MCDGKVERFDDDWGRCPCGELRYMFYPSPGATREQIRAKIRRNEERCPGIHKTILDMFARNEGR